MGLWGRLKGILGRGGGKEADREEWIRRLSAATGQPRAVVERALVNYPRGPRALYGEVAAGRMRLDRTGRLISSGKGRPRSVEDRVKAVDRKIRGKSG